MWISRKELNSINEKIDFLAFEWFKLRYPPSHKIGDLWSKDAVVIDIEEKQNDRLNLSSRTFKILNLKTKTTEYFTFLINPNGYNKQEQTVIK